MKPQVRIASLIDRIEPFYVMEVAKAASKLAREVAHTDRPMIFLNIGEPDFTAPPLVQQADLSEQNLRSQIADKSEMLPALHSQ